MGWSGRRVQRVFGACDWETTGRVNGRQAAPFYDTGTASCDDNQKQFKGIFVRHFAALGRHRPQPDGLEHPGRRPGSAHRGGSGPCRSPGAIRYRVGTMRVMPSLNVTFTDEEMEGVRAAAAAEGKSLKQYMHDLGVREMHRKRFVAGATAWADRLREEFDEAFPDEVPPSQRGREASAAS